MQRSFHLPTPNILLWCFILKSSTFPIYYRATASKEVTEVDKIFRLSDWCAISQMICPSALCGVVTLGSTGTKTPVPGGWLYKRHTQGCISSPPQQVSTGAPPLLAIMSSHCLLACLLLLPASQAAHQVYLQAYFTGFDWETSVWEISWSVYWNVIISTVRCSIPYPTLKPSNLLNWRNMF